MTAHADLRAVLEALPADIQWTPYCGRVEVRTPDGLSRAQMDDLMSWLLRAPALVRALLEERDKLAKQIEDQDDAPEWLSAVDEALGEDRKKAPFIDDAVKLLRKERDALKGEVERLRAKPVTPEQLFSSSKVIWEGWVRARDTEQGCVLDLFNYRVDRSRYVRVVEAEQPQKPVHPKWPADPVEPANPAEPISDELRLRCELAATVLAGLLANNEAGGVDGKADIAHSIADALLAEGRGRMAAEREGKP